ncbi:MAG: hypothetical protein ABIA04_09920 [Pseudomonadota bacterium]
MPDKQGTKVDLIIKKENKILPVEIKLSLNSLKKLRGLKSFCSHYNVNEAFALVFNKPMKFSDDIKIVPPIMASGILSL